MSPIRIVVEIDPVLLGLVLALGMVLSGLYAVLLSTEAGRRVCVRRSHWTVVGGHLLMALTMCFVNSSMAALWLVWSVVHGAPLVIRSEVLRWREETRRAAAVAAAVRGVLRDEACTDRGVGDGHGTDSGSVTWTRGSRGTGALEFAAGVAGRGGSRTGVQRAGTGEGGVGGGAEVDAGDAV